MPRESAITYEQVSAAATAMRSQGIKPTARAVRELLGNTGSMGTINKFLQQWRDKADGEAAIAVRALPISVQQALFAYIDEQVARAQQAFADDLRMRKQESMDVVRENETLHERLADLQSQFDSLNLNKVELAGRYAELAEELAAERRELAVEREKAAHPRFESARAQQHVEAIKSLKDEVSHLRTELEAQRDSRVKAEQIAAVLQAQKTDLEQRVNELKGATAAPSDRSHTGRVKHGEPARSRKPDADSRTNSDAAVPACLDETGASPATAADGDDAPDPRQITLC